MRSIIINFIVLCTITNTYAQSNLAVRVRDHKTKEPLAATVVNIEGTTTGGVADADGIVILPAVPDGRQVIHCKLIGYAERYDTLTFPRPATDTLPVELEQSEEEMEETVVSSTRSSRTIQDIPTRVELIGADELGEKGNMKPGDIRMLLSESTGIQVVQTSATSGNASIRIEGLDGRYTQILKDGFPLYTGFSGGLGLLQTPPLDLKRVEIVKGASSTLYGGGAIAGLVNLITKTPGAERQLDLMVNGTTAGGADLNGFYSQRYGKAGLTLYAAYNYSNGYAPDNVVFAAIPKYSRTTVNPKLFLYPSANTDISIGINTAVEQRLGGDMRYVNGTRDSVHTYYDDNKSTRLSLQPELKHRWKNGDELVVKGSVSYFALDLQTPFYLFRGMQTSTFSEANYSFHRAHGEWIAGVNFLSDAFNEQDPVGHAARNYSLLTYGAFVQNTWDISKRLILETGLRGDYVSNYGGAVLPRVSLLYKPSSALSSRIGGGLGYKAPTLFTEESERINYRNVLPVSDSNKLERSYGGNWDINYRTTIAKGTVRLSVNQLVFYTQLDKPLMLALAAPGLYHFQNTNGHVDALGTETNVKIGYKHFQLFLGYTYTHSHLHEGSKTTESTLTPQHHTNTVLMYEVEGKLKIGAEAYYYSPQKLSDGTTGRDYWLCGLMAEKRWKKLSVFVNLENILDVRQTKFDTIYTGSISDPQFRDIYAPLDGFVMNGGIKLHL